MSFLSQYFRAFRGGVAAILLAASGLFAEASAPAKAAEDPFSTVKVEFFGAEKGFAAGSNQVNLLCVVRNTGKEALAANTLRVRCYALTGFDYTDGELTPLVPALAPGQAAAFRWHLAPTDRSNALVATALLMRAVSSARDAAKSPVQVGAASPAPAAEEAAPVPRAFLSVIPHITSPATANAPASGFAVPSASFSGSTAKIGNERVSLRIVSAAGRAPVGFLAGKTEAAWQSAGVIFPLFSILASGEGQKPWMRAFKWSSSDAHEEAETATLTLTGNCGDDWEAQVLLETHKATGAINGKIRLKARKTARLFSVDLPRITAAVEGARGLPPADGNATLLNSSREDAGTEGVAAANRGSLTSGLAWALRSPIADWQAARLPLADADHSVQLGAAFSSPTDARGEVFLPGGLVEFSFRLFCVSPSVTVRDAQKFAPNGAP